MNKAFIILLTLLGSCCGLTAMETKMKKSKAEIDGDLRPATALIAALKEDIPTEVGNELGQYIIAKSGVVQFVSSKIAPVCTSPEDIPHQRWTGGLTKKDLVVLRHGKVVTVLLGKTGNRIQTLPEESIEECAQRLPVGHQLIAARGVYNKAALSQAGDKMVTVSTFHTSVLEGRERWQNTHESVFAKLWCMRTGACLYTLTGHTDEIHSAKFNRSGSKIITASVDRTAKIWDVETGECLQTLRGHEAAVRDARFNRAGDKAATACGDGTAKVWDVETGQCLATFVHAADRVFTVRTVKFSSNDDFLVTVTTGNEVMIWFIERPELFLRRFYLPSEGEDGVQISFSKEGNTMLAYGDGDARMEATALLYSFATNDLYDFSNENENIRFAAFNEAGDKVITAGEDGSVNIWSTATYECIHTFLGEEEGIDFAAFDQKDERIVTYCFGFNKKSIKVWSISTGICLYDMEGALCKLNGSPFVSERDALITTCLRGSQIRLWDLSYFQRTCKRLTLEQAFLLKALCEVAFLRKLIENRLNKGIPVLDNEGNPVTSVQQIVYDFEKNPDFLKAYTELDEPVKKVLNPYVVNHVMAPRSHALSSHSSMQILD